MTGPRVDYSPDNPFAQAKRARYSADNPFAQPTSGGGIVGGSSTTAPVPDPDERTFGERAGAVVHGLSQGLTFGFGDEILGALDPAHTAQDYRDRGKQLAERNPKTEGAAEFAGALAPVITSGGTAGGAAAPSLLRATGRAAVQGAAYGGLAGFGSAEGGIGNRASAAAGSALAGGAIGAALPGGAKAAGMLYRGARSILLGAAEAAGSTRALEAATRNAEATADRLGLGDVAASGKSLQQLRAEADAARGTPQVLADLLGKPGQRRLRAAVGLSPEAEARADAVLGPRELGRTQRVEGALASRSGQPRENLAQLAEKLQSARTAAAERLYGTAFRNAAKEIDDQELFDLLQNYPSFRESWPKAVKIAQEREGLRAFASRTRGVGAFPGESAAEEVANKNARGLLTSAREPSGGFRRADTVSEEGILEELKSLYNRRSDRTLDTNYSTAITDYGDAIQVSRSKGRVTSQSKARTNIADWDRIIANYEEELKKRGYTETSIAQKLWGDAAGDEAAFERAALQAQDEGTAAGADDWLFDMSAPVPDAPAVPRRKPTPGELHNLKLAMDERIEGAAGANPLTNSGAGNTIAGLMGRNRDALVAKLDEHVPGYDVARQTFAAGSEAMRAVQAGEKAVGKSGEAIGGEIAALSTDEAKRLYRLAFANALGRDVRQTPAGGNAARRVFKGNDRVGASADVGEQLRHAFGDESEYQAFLADLVREGRMAKTEAVALSGSRTAPLGKDIDAIQDSGADLLENIGKRGILGGVVKSGAQAIAARANARTPKVANALADALLQSTENPETLLQYLDRLGQLERAGGVKSSQGTALARALGRYAGMKISQP